MSHGLAACLLRCAALRGDRTGVPAFPPPWTAAAPREAVLQRRRRAASAAHAVHASSVAEEGDLVFYAGDGNATSAGVVVGAICSFRYLLPCALGRDAAGLVTVGAPSEDAQPVQLCVDDGAGLLSVLPATQRGDAAALQRAHAAALEAFARQKSE